jgi:hypothetical protein
MMNEDLDDVYCTVLYSIMNLLKCREIETLWWVIEINVGSPAIESLVVVVVVERCSSPWQSVSSSISFATISENPSPPN